MIPFWKTQSVGNDFVLIHAADLAAAGWDPWGPELGSLAPPICARRFGIGADGLLVVDRHVDGLRLRMFNADGSEDFCGNGMRCALTHARRIGWIPNCAIVHHGGRAIEGWLEDGVASTRLPPASFAPADVPTTTDGEIFQQEWPIGRESLALSVLSTGSAHAVAIVEALPDDRRFERVSRTLESDPAFPERVSLMWARPETASSLRIRIWERGVGETLGCGTGSTAVAVVWARLNGPGAIEVINPGGRIVVELDDWTGSPIVSARASETYSGSIELRAFASKRLPGERREGDLSASASRPGVK